MQKDNDLNQLFRARLPIASLPKDFADRLTKAILDEVTQLRQSTLLSTHQSDSHGDDSEEFKASSIPTRHLLTKPTTAIIFLLLINCYLGTLLQGCSFAVGAPSSTNSFITTQSNRGTAGRVSSYGEMISKDQSRRPETVIAGLTTIVRALHLPPLQPLKPKLPILQAIAAPDSPLVNLPDPPGTDQAIERIITVTVLYEQSVGQTSSQEKQPTATMMPPENPNPVATPTTDTTIPNHIETPTPAFPPTPVLNIFEPTTTPEAQAPLPTPTALPPATPTIFIRPWPTNEAAAPPTPAPTQV